MKSHKKVIILDRDGIINHDSDNYIKSPDEWHVIDGVPEAITRLNRAGYLCVIATNQSGIGRGLYSLQTFLQITQKMNHILNKVRAKIEFILYCPHVPDDNCNCRKPRTGMLDEAIQRLRIEPQSVYFVGDAIRDIQAAKAAEMKPVLITTGKGKQTKDSNHADLENVPIYDSLSNFVDQLLTDGDQ